MRTLILTALLLAASSAHAQLWDRDGREIPLITSMWMRVPATGPDTFTFSTSPENYIRVALPAVDNNSETQYPFVDQLDAAAQRLLADMVDGIPQTITLSSSMMHLERPEYFFTRPNTERETTDGQIYRWQRIDLAGDNGDWNGLVFRRMRIAASTTLMPGFKYLDGTEIGTHYNVTLQWYGYGPEPASWMLAMMGVGLRVCRRHR